MNSAHVRFQRRARMYVIDNIIGAGKVIHEFYVDRQHKDGPEIHMVTDTGIIEIYNARTNKFITALIARPEQLKKLYATKNMECPQWLIDKAQANKEKGYNHI